MSLRLFVFFSKKCPFQRGMGLCIMHCHRRGLFHFFLCSIKNTDSSGQIEMNRQLKCLPACNLSLFVSYFLLISLTNSIFHSNSLSFPSCSVNPSLIFCYFRTTETAEKNSLHNIYKVMKRLPSGLKPTWKEEQRSQLYNQPHVLKLLSAACPKCSYYSLLW